MARDFSEDGAAGAGGGGSASTTGTVQEMEGGTSPASVPAAGGGTYGAPTPMGTPTPPKAVDPGPAGNGGMNTIAMANLWNIQHNPGFVGMFADGGAVPDDGGDGGDGGDGAIPDGGQGNPDQSSNDIIGAALAAVDGAQKYGHQKYGLDGGGQQTAGAIPMAPGSQSDGPRPLPAPGPLVPTDNPFGRRQGQPFGRVAANMPAVPASQSDSGVVQLPGPGTLAPAANPFGKRLVRPPQPSGPAIPDDEEG